MEKAKYVCNTRCFHMLKLWQPGEVFPFGEEKLPRDKEGNIRHFEAVDVGPGEEAPPVVEEKKTTETVRGPGRPRKE